jgi:hypothetical protein
MSAATTATHTVPAGLITHCTAIIRGHQNADITCYHAGTADARITLVWGGVMVTLYSAGAAHGLLEAFVTARAATARLPRLLPPPVNPHESVFARPTVGMEFTGRPTYAVVQQNGPARSGDRAIHWVDLHTGPITWQIRDRAGLSSATEILHRAYISAIAVFPDGAQHEDDPSSGDHDAA